MKRKMKLVVSGGPTHEYLDDVRFLGNPSTGAMGIAVARAAQEAEIEVTLVLGPTHLEDPEGVQVQRVTSALEMQAAIEEALEEAQGLIMTAAVADYRPRERVDGKLKKGDSGLVLHLTKNPDILAQIGKMPHDLVLVGFALEAADPEQALEYAQSKLKRKNLDLIVLNRTGSFGGSSTEDVTVLTREGDLVPLGAPKKPELARWLVAAWQERVNLRHEKRGT